MAAFILLNLEFGHKMSQIQQLEKKITSHKALFRVPTKLIDTFLGSKTTV